VLYLTRFILGFSQAFVVIYAPVWINEFSPAEANTRWMAGFHSACVVGILGGYIVAQVIVNNFNYYTTWRLSIYIQGCFQFILSIITMFVDNRNLDVKEKISDEKVKMLNNGKEERETNQKMMKQEISRLTNEKRIDTVDADEMGHICEQFKVL
jgi:MFS family permease